MPRKAFSLDEAVLCDAHRMIKNWSSVRWQATSRPCHFHSTRLCCAMCIEWSKNWSVVHWQATSSPFLQHDDLVAIKSLLRSPPMILRILSHDEAVLYDRHRKRCDDGYQGIGQLPRPPLLLYERPAQHQVFQKIIFPWVPADRIRLSVRDRESMSSIEVKGTEIRGWKQHSGMWAFETTPRRYMTSMRYSDARPTTASLHTCWNKHVITHASRESLMALGVSFL